MAHREVKKKEEKKMEKKEEKKEHKMEKGHSCGAKMMMKRK